MDTMLAILIGLTLFDLIYLVGIEIELRQICKQEEEIKQVLKGFRDKENL